jgi:biopolymer transport protein ExbB
MCIRLALTLLVVILASAPGAFAQEKDAAPKAKETTLLETIHQGGAIGYTIMLMNVVAVALIINYAMQIKRDILVPPEMLGQLESLFEDEEYEEAMTLCESQPNYLSNVIAAGLPRISSGYAAVERAMEEVEAQETTRLYQQIGWLSLVGALAPMLGLLGTVQGMIGAFNVLAASGGTADAAALAGNIGMALVTTAQGLICAIPVLSFYFFFRNRVQQVVLEVSMVTEELMSKFRTQ